jgi:DNA polymerase
MIEAEKAGARITMTIHDEIVCEVPLDSDFTEDMLRKCMITTPDWAEGMGFILDAECWSGPYYKK